MTPQEVSELADKEYAQTGQPQPVKIFGIMHVIFSAFGILFGLWGLLVVLVGNPLMKFMSQSPEMRAQMQAQQAMQDQMMEVTLIATFLGLLIAGLMLTAGIRLLQKRRSGLKWSNRYAWTSLVGKLVNLIIALAYTYPIMKESNALAASGSPMGGAMESVMLASMIGGVLVACVYPVLTLVFLNRPKVKTWFANQPE